MYGLPLKLKWSFPNHYMRLLLDSHNRLHVTQGMTQSRRKRKFVELNIPQASTQVWESSGKKSLYNGSTVEEFNAAARKTRDTDGKISVKNISSSFIMLHKGCMSKQKHKSAFANSLIIFMSVIDSRKSKIVSSGENKFSGKYKMSCTINIAKNT